jgi:competence protein ComEC
VPFAIGIIAGIYSSHFVSNNVSLLVVLLSIIAFSITTLIKKYTLRWLSGFTATVILIVFGFLWSSSNKNIFHQNYFEKYANQNSLLIVKIDEYPKEKEKSFKAIANVIGIENEIKQEITLGKIQLYFSKTAKPDIHYGDILVIPFKNVQLINEAKNPYEFDYREFMSFKQIHHQAFLKNGEWYFLQNKCDNIFLKKVYFLSEYLVKVLKQYVSNEQSFSIASSLLLGARETLDFHLIKAYSSAGAMHVLAVSGLHVAILFLIIEKLLFFMERKPHLKLIRSIIIVLIIWIYAFLTGFSPSVQRAAIMFSFITIGKHSGRGYNIYNVLAASAIIQLLLNPFTIMEVGFQLSYLAVAGIVMFQKFFYDFIYIKNKIIDYLWQITCVSFAAQIITFPIGLLYFYQFPLYFFVSNLFVIPVSFVIMMIGTALLVLHPIPYCGLLIGKVLSFVIWLMNESIFIVEQLPFSLIQGLSISILESWLIYFLIILLFAYIQLKNSKIIIAMLVVIALLSTWNTVENYFQYKQKKFVVYAVNKNYAYDFIIGKENLLFAPKELRENYSAMQFHIMHNWWENDIMKNSYAEYNKEMESKRQSYFFQYKNYLFFNNKRIVVINNKLPQNKIENRLNVDYVIITKGNKINSLAQIQRLFNTKVIIADGTISKSKIAHLKKEKVNRNTVFHSVTENGAFVDSFN